jgi:hypothetical protein
VTGGDIIVQYLTKKLPNVDAVVGTQLFKTECSVTSFELFIDMK